MNKKTLRGFTLIELVVVIAIIGMIMTVSFVSFSNARQKARDTKRLSDVTQIQNALSVYFRDEGRYPETMTFGSELIGSSTSRTYMTITPQNPSPRNDGICPNDDYIYQAMATGTDYKIDFCLSETVGNLTAGRKCLTPMGIKNETCTIGDSFSCPGVSVVQYDGGPYDSTGLINDDSGYYRTVQIGTQCWLRDNLNAGAMVAGTADQANNSILEKYCYDNQTWKCNVYGALYQWDEAMQYSSSPGTQGVCPSGWHIPTDPEFYTLENYLQESGLCNAGRDNLWDCDPAGSKLKEGGTDHWNNPSSGDNSSGFTALPAGSRYYNGGSFEGQNTLETYLWSSSAYNVSSAWHRFLGNSNSSVLRGNYYKTNGYSVRCLKN